MTRARAKGRPARARGGPDRPRAAAGARRAPRLPHAWALVLAALFAVALAWRLAYLGRLARTPFLDSLTADARVYWDWAGALAHGGHGPPAYFFGPLYPWVLAALRAVLGDSVLAVLRVQAVAGAAAVVLLADAARRLTRPWCGAVVGVALACARMSVFFDGLVLMESLLFLVEAALIWLVVRRGASARARTLLVAGCLVGLLALGRPSHGLLVLAAALALVPWRAAGRAAWRPALALAAGLALVVAPVTLRNLVVAREWIPITYSGGYNLYVGNHPQATGGWVAIADVGASGGDVESLDGRAWLRRHGPGAMTPAQSSRHWSREAWRFVRAHPGRALGLTLRKLAMLWNRAEYPQIENAYVYERVAGPLGLPLVGSFAFLALPGLAGAWAAWRRGAAGRFAVAYVAALTVAFVPFFVTDRFRHHFVPALALLAACGLEWAWGALRARRPRALGRGGAALLGAAAVLLLPLPRFGAERLRWSAAADIGSRWLEKGRPDAALPFLEEAARIEAAEARRRATAATRPERAQLHGELGQALLALGRPAEAVPWLQRGLGEAPDEPALARRLAEAYAALGTAPSGAPVLDRASQLEVRGWQLARENRLAEAVDSFAAALRLEPRRYDTWGALVRADLQLGRHAAAESALAQARSSGLPEASYWAHRAALLATSGDAAGARAALARVPGTALANDAPLRDLVEATRRLVGASR